MRFLLSFVCLFGMSFMVAADEFSEPEEVVQPAASSVSTSTSVEQETATKIGIGSSNYTLRYAALSESTEFSGYNINVTALIGNRGGLALSYSQAEGDNNTKLSATEAGFIVGGRLLQQGFGFYLGLGIYSDSYTSDDAVLNNFEASSFYGKLGLVLNVGRLSLDGSYSWREASSYEDQFLEQTSSETTVDYNTYNINLGYRF